MVGNGGFSRYCSGHARTDRAASALPARCHHRRRLRRRGLRGPQIAGWGYEPSGFALTHREVLRIRQLLAGTGIELRLKAYSAPVATDQSRAMVVSRAACCGASRPSSPKLCIRPSAN
jgi:hypothetical protein